MNHKMLDIIFILITGVLLSCSNTNNERDAFSQSAFKDMTAQMEIATQNGKIDSTKTAKISFDKVVYDFGKVNEGTVVSFDFKFTNVGKKDLYLLYHETTCGCTVPEFTKDAVKPGKSDKITVKFDTKGKKLSQTKKIKIFTNSIPNMTELTLKGYVIPKK